MIKKHVFFMFVLFIFSPLNGLSEKDYQRITAAWHQLHKLKPTECLEITKEDYYNFGRTCFALNLEHAENKTLQKLVNHIDYHYLNDRIMVCVSTLGILLGYYINYTSLKIFFSYIAYSMMSYKEIHDLFAEYGRFMIQFVQE